MRYLIALISCFLVGCLSHETMGKEGRVLKIAIIDTGLDLKDPRFDGHICSSGHKSFSGDIADTHGHGTHVAGLILKNAGPGNYCFVIYKFYDSKNTGKQNLENELKAIESAANYGVNIVNLSGGGPVFQEAEALAIQTHPKITFVVAAGNEGQNLDIPGNYYFPASYFLKNEIIVENVDSYGSLVPSSNWSKKAVKEVGDNVISYLPNGREGRMTGTSQATAVVTGKLVRSLLNASTRH